MWWHIRALAGSIKITLMITPWCRVSLESQYLPNWSRNSHWLGRSVTVLWKSNIWFSPEPYRGRDSSVGIATHYGLDGPGIKSLWGFSAPVQTSPGAHPASYTMGTRFFQGVKQLGRGIDHPAPSGAKIEGRVELYICSPPGPLWPVLGRTVPLPELYVCGNKRIMNILLSFVA